MEYAYITIINILVKLKKNTSHQHCSEWSAWLYHSLVLYESFIAMLVWGVFFHFSKFLLLSLVFAYIYISEGSVETHLPCGEKYKNHFIANWQQSVPVKEF